MPVWLPPLGLGLLLSIELLALMISFDTEGLDGIGTIWAQLVNWAPQYIRLALGITAAVVALAAAQPPADVRRFVTARRGASPIVALGVHLGAFALFAFVTSIIVATGAAYRQHQPFWTIAWFLAGLVTLGAWMLALAPLRGWRDAIATGRQSIGWGITVGFAAWACGFLTEGLWIPLAQKTFALVAWALEVFYPQVVQNPERLVVGTPAFRVVIAPECSGYEGIGLILTFLSGYLWLFRRELRFPAALLLLPIGAALIWLANVARIVALIAIGTAGWRAVALGGFHSQAGWMSFIVITLGFIALTSRVGYFRESNGQRSGIALSSRPTRRTSGQ